MRGQLQPLARSAFRTLGLAASASQQEIYEKATSLRLAHKLGVEKTFDEDLAWLGALSRTEADVRDALGRLADPPRRLLERLFWFHEHPEVTLPKRLPQVWEAVHGLLQTESPAARHDAALLSLAALHRLDPKFSEPDAWARAFGLWREVIEREEFWSLLVAADLKGEFEQLANFGEVKALRGRAARLLTAHVFERARDAAARDDFKACERALGVLRAASLPPSLLDEYLDATLGPVEDRVVRVCDEAFGPSPPLHGVNEHRNRLKYFLDEAWKNFHWRLKPQLGRFLLLAGAEYQGLRRACEHAAEKLNRLAAAYKHHGFDKQSLHVYRQSRSIAPPGSGALAAAEEGLRGQDPSAAPLAYGETGYAAALAAELADVAVPPRLFDTERVFTPNAGGGDTTGGCLGQIVFYVIVIASCFLLDKCGLINTRRPSRYTPSTMNLNYNVPRIVIPPLPKLEPLHIPPLTTPTPPRRTRRRQTGRGEQPKGTRRRAADTPAPSITMPTPRPLTTGTPKN